MSGSIKGFIVVLKHDISEEHAENIRQAFMLFDNVIDVTKVPTDIGGYMAERAAKHELRSKLWEVLK